MRAREMSSWGKLFVMGLGIWAMLAGMGWAAPPVGDTKNARDSTQTDGKAATFRGGRDDRGQPDRDRAPAASRQRLGTRRSELLAQNEPPGSGRAGKRDTPEPPRENIRRDNPPPPREDIRRDNPPPRENIRRDNPPPPRENIRRDTPPPPPENIKREAPAKQYQPAPPAPSLRRDNSDATKDLRRRPAADKALEKGQPPATDRSRIGDVRSRLERQDRVKPNPEPGGVSGRLPPRDLPLRDAKQPRFADRLKAGDLNRLAAGENAQKVRLADQYALWQQGDVARRLELQRHGLPPKLYHGVVSPAYQQSCFQYRYWGPSWFSGVCWYPTWNPWVKWSWYYHCRPWWDPRPLWCRPVVYVACPLWVYWATPAWQPLPVVACGTWVDFSPVALAPQQADLQLVAVRFVDPGHPEEKLGPRYRVWFRNNGSAPVTQPFNVMLFASNDVRLAANLPQAGVRVTAIDAGDIQSVDIRLPVEVLSMNRDAQGNPAPFAMLHVLVDANREVPETSMANNGARLAVGDILPVDPAAFEIDPVAARPGGEILLAGEGLGPQPGRALVVVGGQELDAEILGWYDLGVRLALPRVALPAPTEADVIVIRGDGAAANPLKVTLTP